MADDERADARDPQVATWLEVEPLDDVTRRRLVSTALREGAAPEAPAPARPSKAWRWIAAAAVIVVVLVAGLALLTANGGHDERQATRRTAAEATPKATEGPRDVGDFGDLDQAANLQALRDALSGSEGTRLGAPAVPAPQAATDAAGSGSFSTSGCSRGVLGTVLAQGTGTLDGRAVTVVLSRAADGKRSLDAFFRDSCEIRHLR